MLPQSRAFSIYWIRLLTHDRLHTNVSPNIQWRMPATNEPANAPAVGQARQLDRG
jgi:hypothetical protein